MWYVGYYAKYFVLLLSTSSNSYPKNFTLLDVSYSKCLPVNYLLLWQERLISEIFKVIARSKKFFVFVSTTICGIETFHCDLICINYGRYFFLQVLLSLELNQTDKARYVWESCLYLPSCDLERFQRYIHLPLILPSTL